MNADEFLARVIDDGLAAARMDYARPGQADHLRGALDGFALCRGLNPCHLRDLLTAVQQDETRQILAQAPDGWYWRCRAAEVEWVCNVFSAALLAIGVEPIAKHLPTAAGVLAAARLVGVSP